MDRRHPEERNLRASTRSTLVSLLVGAAALLFAATPRAEPPLEDTGSEPASSEREPMLDAICELDAATDICACRGQPTHPTQIERLRSGSFTEVGASERLVALRGCERTGTALLEARQKGTWSARRFYPRARTETCLTFGREQAPDVLVCHRAVSSDTWRIGWVYSLEFPEGGLQRRQLSSYESNARGCPASRLRTTHPVDWERWQVEDDPRPPLLTVRLQHRNGDVPDAHPDACRAMERGNPVFGPRRIRTEYFALRGGRFEFEGAHRVRQGERGEPEERADRERADREGRTWLTDRRPHAPVCRREDVLENVRSHRDSLADCYRDALRDSPDLEGVIRMRWTVDGTGSVESVELLDDGAGNEDLQSCVRSVVAAFEFPPPRGGDQCTFVYPFRFAPKSSRTNPDRSRFSLHREEPR